MSTSSRRTGLSVLVSLVLVLGTLLAAGMSVPAAAAPDPGPGQGVVEGFVHDVSIGALEGVVVDAFAVGADPDAEPAAASTTTPSETDRALGYWALALPAGDYRLRFSGEGLQTQWYGGGAGDVVEVYEGDTYRLSPTTVRSAGQALVTGYLRDPAARRYINDLQVEAVDGSEVGASALTYRSTSDWRDGFFALHLPAGTWQVRVTDAATSRWTWARSRSRLGRRGSSGPSTCPAPRGQRGMSRCRSSTDSLGLCRAHASRSGRSRGRPTSR